jgi:hypothetical protein
MTKGGGRKASQPSNLTLEGGKNDKCERDVKNLRVICRYAIKMLFQIKCIASRVFYAANITEK